MKKEMSFGHRFLICIIAFVGYDRVRNVEIGNKNFELNKLEEAFTSEHWLVRIYRVKKPANRGAK